MDEADQLDLPFAGHRVQPDGSVVADGRMPIRDLNRVMGWKLPDNEVTTVAGLLTHGTSSIPERGQHFKFYGYRFEVLRRDRNTLVAVRITPLDEPLDQFTNTEGGDPGAQGAEAKAAAETLEARHAKLENSVALLEIALNQLRRQVEARSHEREIGPGHNQGPNLDPVSAQELDDVEELVKLLKDQPPIPPPQVHEHLRERSAKATKVADKIGEYLDELGKEFVKKAGGELGKRVVQAPFWTAVAYAISRVAGALIEWLAHVPH
jgi:hypothetical protein